jgi:hypothetical protein
MKRVKTSPTPPGGQTCAQLRPQYASMETFLKYKDSNLNTDQLATYVGGILASDLQNTGTPNEQAEKQARVTMNLGTLRIFEQRTADMLKCVQQDIIQKQTYSGKIYSLQMEIEDKQKEVTAMESTAKEAEERAELLDKPYSKTTRWETWFPLGRPLRAESLPVLLSFALLFLTLSLGMFLRLTGVELSLHWIGFGGSSYLSGYGIGR